MKKRTQVSLVYGVTGVMREEVIAARLDVRNTNVVIAEGFASGGGMLDKAATQVFRIAPGCPCCTGNLTMRVHLHRILRHPPDQLFISLANTEHLPGIRQFLQDPTYHPHLNLGEDIECTAK